MSTISVNGKTYTGRNVSMVGNKVFIDGKEADVDQESKVINIVVTGDIDSLKVEHCKTISIKGDVGSLSSVSGDVECGDVTGSVSTVSGDVRVAGQVAGGVSTVSGDIIQR